MIPTRAAALETMHRFAPHMGRDYAEGRNSDPGCVSHLSPYLRRRLITEPEVIGTALAAHGEAAHKFVEEVAWRSYFKGFLEQHPAIWKAYLDELALAQNRLATEQGLHDAYHDACEGRSGIACFDDWAKALVAEGWLHNHARMWFASIWIFTLRLPWALGAALFMRHLLDGDPASNTLSWRWVAGLHTRGKHYVARADNIARFTGGRYDPRGQLDEAPEPLVEAVSLPRIALPPSDRLPDAPFALVLHDEDLSPPFDLSGARAVATLCAAGGADPVVAFAEAALADAGGRLDRPVTRLRPEELAGWVQAQTLPIVTAWAPVGPAASLLGSHPLIRVRGEWDSAVWPHATGGFFKLRQRLPGLLGQLIASAKA